MDNLTIAVGDLNSIKFFIAFTPCGECIDHGMHVETRGQFMEIFFHLLGPGN